MSDEAKVAEKPATLPLHPMNMELAEHSRTFYRIVPAEGVTLEDFKRPEYWSHVARDLKINDKLEVLAEDGTWYAELLVRDVSQTGARVSVLMHLPLEAEDIAAPRSDLEAKHHPSVRWTVVRKADKKRLAENLADKQAALQWIANNPNAV
jgi:hypothetical protein